MILIDTNVLLRLVQPNHSSHPASLAALTRLYRARESLCIVPQILYEFWVVATRPIDVNGLGMTASQAQADIAKIVTRFRLMRDERGVYKRWEVLVTALGVVGKNAHDARLVAAMQRHGVTRILTFNVGDFSRYPGVEVLDAASVGSP
jgi:predicted nucleic acid-binding protein